MNKTKMHQSKTHLGACSNKGAQWILPTSHPKSLDNYFEGNVFKKHNNFDKRWELASFCPIDADPYLPWIHDAFPSNDGSYVQFIISKKRRCNTDPTKFQSDLKNLEPQVALMQPIPVKRLNASELAEKEALKKLWTPKFASGSFIGDDDVPRYSLVTSLDDADADGKYTRFICRFHTHMLEESSNDNEPKLTSVILGESLSNYPYNPEHLNYRKRNSKPMLTPSNKGHDEQIWNSVYTIRCPVPHSTNDGNTTNNIISNIIAGGKSVFNGAPSLYLDVIPIRKHVRREHETPEKLAWDHSHVLPLVEASGRWVNIPICLTPKIDEGLAVGDVIEPARIREPKSTMNSSSLHNAQYQNKHPLFCRVCLGVQIIRYKRSGI